MKEINKTLFVIYEIRKNSIRLDFYGNLQDENKPNNNEKNDFSHQGYELLNL